jgi:uncharacterized protein
VEDRSVVAAQLGREPRAFRRVAVRCPWGRPAVTEQHPYDESGNPFPTTYYLTCPRLVASVSRLEAAGGVERWSARAQSDPELRAAVERATAEQGRVRVALAGDRRGRDGGASLVSGIGGSHNPLRLKCLHAHVAYALARPGYALGEQVVGELEPLWPDGVCCTTPAELG